MASDHHVESSLGAFRGVMVRDAVLDSAGARVFASAGREDSMDWTAHVVSEMAPRDPGRPGNGRRSAFLTAPIVPGRPLPADQGQTRSALVQPISDHDVLSLGDSCRSSRDGDRAVFLGAVTGRETRSASLRRSEPRDRTTARGVRDLSFRRSFEEWSAALSLDVAGRNALFLA